jgi:hypothetical protein
MRRFAAFTRPALAAAVFPAGSSVSIPMLLNPLIANRKRRALGDGWRDEISRRNRSFGLLNEAAARRCCKNIHLCSTAGIDAVFERKERFIADVAD